MPYADLEDLRRYGLPARTLAAFSPAAQQAALEAASSLFDDDALARRYDLPLTSWSTGLRRRVAIVAAYDLLSVHGFNPEGSDQLVVDRYNEAMRWLRDVRNGDADATVVDADPSSDPGDPWVESDEPRGL